MSEPDQPKLLDRAVAWVAAAMDAVGLNGRRLLWRWNQKRRDMAEAGMRGEQVLRGARAKHKMCPACRALVDRDATECAECGVSLRAVRRPGTGRAVSNLLPGITATTSLLMLVNGFWFAIMLMAQIRSGGAGGLGLFSAFSPELIVNFGSGLSFPASLSDGAITGGEWWRRVTPMFLHGGILHFFFNSYLLMNLGPVVEEIWGPVRYWVIYLACGLAGASLSMVRPVNTVGASGAIFGLIGLLLVYGMRHHGALGESMKSLIVRLMVYTLIFSLMSGGSMRIDHFNHLGGFACGALAALVVPPRSGERAESPVWQILALLGVGLVLFAFYKVAMLPR